MEYLEGVLQIGNVVLAIIAGIIAISLFRASGKKDFLKPWKLLIAALVLFGIEEIFGALRSFSIYSHPFITHIIPTFMLVLLIWALVLQIKMLQIKKEGIK